MNGVTLLTDAQILARLRSRLRKVNEKICKLKQKNYDGDDLYRVLPIDDDPKDYVDDEHGVYTLNKLIDYVEKRQVKKVNGGKPGFVIYHTNYSMVASPSLSGLQEIR